MPSLVGSQLKLQTNSLMKILAILIKCHFIAGPAILLPMLAGQDIAKGFNHDLGDIKTHPFVLIPLPALTQ